MRSFRIYCLEKVIKFLQLQLFISLLSFPLIAAWGLPISIMAVIGNFIFTPWVIVFVAVSTVIFFTELLCIPNGIFIALLEYITEWWYYCLSWGKKSWVIGIPTEMIPITYVYAIGALLIICHKKWGQLLESTIILSIFYLSLFGIWYCSVPTPVITSLTKGKAELSLVCSHGRTILYDNDYIRRIQSSESWVEYTLIPLLGQSTGTSVIDIVWLNSFSSKAIAVLMNLMEYAQVRIIKIPYFSETLAKEEWRDFFKMYEKAYQEGTRIERSPAQPVILHDNDVVAKMMISSRY